MLPPTSNTELTYRTFSSSKAFCETEASGSSVHSVWTSAETPTRCERALGDI